MEIVLNQTDIEDIIKKSFTGIKTIKFNNKTVKATLDVDPKEFVQFRVKTGLVVKPNVETTTEPVKVDPEARLNTELKKGLMVSGGSNRSIIPIG